MTKWAPVTEEGKKIYNSFENKIEGAERFAEMVFNNSNIDEYANLKRYEFDQNCENQFEAIFILNEFEECKKRARGYKNKVDKIDDMVREIRNTIHHEMEEARGYEDHDKMCPEFIELMDFVDDRLYDVCETLRRFGR